MNKKFKSGMIIIMGALILGLTVSPVSAKRGGDDSNLKGDSAGVAGSTGGNLKATGLCLSEDCKKIRNQINSISNTLNTYKSEIIDYQSQISKIKKEKNFNSTQKEIDKIKKDIESKKAQSKPIDNLESKLTLKQSDLQKLLDQIKENETKIETVNAKILDTEKQKQELENEYERVAGQEKNGGINKDSIKKDQMEGTDKDTETDVEPEKSGYLKSGDLLAWGVPGIGIPSIPRVTHEEKSKTVSDRQVSDETYNAVKSVEQESEKITDTDKDAFLMQLNMQAAQNK